MEGHGDRVGRKDREMNKGREDREIRWGRKDMEIEGEGRTLI